MTRIRSLCLNLGKRGRIIEVKLLLNLSFEQDKCQVEAVSVGAVLSDYQRVRVENV